MSYTIDEIITPFWAENSGFMTGRDPLGIQNSSITVYGRLLPGMTNLTQRVRYYGFYCWLLKEYDKLKLAPGQKTLQHQYNFIRRAELIIAFLMVNKFAEEKSVIGSDYANKHIEDIVSNNFYDIQKGADKVKTKSKGEVYWDYISGALGQYYAGSLISLDLIESIDKFFHIRERGLKLSQAFEESISQECRNYFLSLVESAKLNFEDIVQIEPFSLNAIPLKSSEWKFLKAILLSDDGISFRTRDGAITRKRRESINLYLTFSKENINDIRFDQWVHDTIGQEVKSNSALFGWYYYYVNEAFHIALETIFWAFLENLDGRIASLQDYLDEFRDHILNENFKNRQISANGKLSEALDSVRALNLSEQLNELELLARKSPNWKRALGKATELLMIIYNATEKSRRSIIDFEYYNAIDQQKGNITEHLVLYIEKNLELSYSNHIEKLITTLMNDHVSTAFRKMGSGESNLLKFIVEDNIIAHVQTMSPKRTTPRIQTLHNFLIDLGFLNVTGTLTNRGIKLLEEMQQTND